MAKLISKNTVGDVLVQNDFRGRLLKKLLLYVSVEIFGKQH